MATGVVSEGAGWLCETRSICRGVSERGGRGRWDCDSVSGYGICVFAGGYGEVLAAH
jgi:hypothetical protein